ncbi:MAG: hypothetical protein H8D23_23900 [Candidatus Brocadiales bacterium]|nr:hypothetical protein [Candidatus Brocadiales bacterium]
MKNKNFSSNALRLWLEQNKIATIEDLKISLGTNVTMTAYRKLKELSYLSSYSHRGKYYTLADIVQFNENGLWEYNSIWFSKYGTLIKTAEKFINLSEMGYSSNELELELHAEVKKPLLQLLQIGAIVREKICGVYIYVSNEPIIRKRQLLLRKELTSIPVNSLRLDVLTHELKAAIFLFYSLLDEKQRRLYAGLESIKMGHGGDKKIADLLDIDVHTVAKGRNELFDSNIEQHTIRKKGAGRKSVKKKYLK